MNLYELSKKIATTEKPMDPIEFNRTVIAIAKDLIDYKYTMLLNNENKDYTVLVNKNKDEKNFASELAECLCNRGQVVFMDKQPDGAWEIWIKMDNEPVVYYLFNYEQGVVEV